jgi:myosin-5
LKQVAWWIDDRWEWLAGCWEELQHIRQAVMFLTEPDKPQLTLQEIGDEICPMLTTHQLYRLANMFNDDTHGTEGVSAEVRDVASNPMLVTALM